MKRAEAEADYTSGEDIYLAHVRALQAALWPPGVPKEPVFPHGRQPLTHYLREWAKRQPDKAAVLFYGHSLTYAELDRLSDRFASLLMRLGACKGHRVAVFLPNCPQFYVCFFGILKAGCVHVPVNPMFTRPELAYEINDTQAQIVVAHDQLAYVVEEIREECGIEHLIVTSFGDALGPEPEGPLPAALTEARVVVARSIDLISALAEESGLVPEVDVALDDIAALNYTGGTTGMPKGCVHTQFDMLFTGAVMGSVSMTVTADDVIINFWPIFWMAGEDLGVVLPMVTGATCVLMARWDPVAYMRAVQRHRATISNMVVDNAVEIMDRPDASQYDLSSLREVMVASFVKKLNPAFRDGWRRLTGTVLREAAWGMTETHSYDAFNRGWQDGDRDLNQRQIFCGIPVPETDFKILEFGSDKLLPLGEEGELCVRTPSILKGYWNKPDATAQVLENGWLRTGDIGMISEQGTIHFLGRRKEMLKVKGMSVFPSEIEAVLGQHPDVTGSGVVGRADEARGQVPVAFVTIAPERKATTNSEILAAFCRERLAIYKIPEIRIVDALPMTATGKVKKEELSKLCG